MRQQALTLQKPTLMNYLVYLPPDYEATKTYPLVLFLHGKGERGTDVQKVALHGLPFEIEAGKDFPFIAVSPQCPAEGWWTDETAALITLLDEIEAAYPIDPTRIYLTGLSMGGYGTWALAIEQPTRFAAVAPICGGGDPARVCVLKDVPIWVFHGAKDTVVLLHESEQMVNALQSCGSQVNFTIYPDLTHNSWSITYANPAFYEWLLAQQKS